MERLKEMKTLKLKNTFTHEIQVLYDDDTCVVVKEYENEHIPADDLFNIANEYKDKPYVVGIRVIRTTTEYSVVDIPFETE